MRKSTTYTVGAVALTLVLAPGLAAQAKTATYNVHHDLVIKPNAGFGGEWQAGWRYGIGGIFELTESENEAKVPLLGDLPIIGNAFKTRTRSSNKQEMLVFITPKMIADRAAAR